MRGTVVADPIEILVIDLDGQRFGIPIAAVREIVRAATYTPTNDSPYVEGVIDIRGIVSPIIDLRELLQLTPKPIAHTDHFVVLESNDKRCVIRVDRAICLAVVAFANVSVEAPLVHGLASQIAQTEEGIVRIIDVEKLEQSMVKTAARAFLSE